MSCSQSILAKSLFSFLTTLVIFFPVYAANLKVLTELSPPYQTIVNGEVTGTATQQVTQILLRAGLVGEFHMYPWSRAYQQALTEPNTLIYSMAKTPEREALFHWLAPVVSYQLAYVSLKQRDDIQLLGANDIAKYSLAVQRNDIAHDWIAQQGLREDEHFITCPDIVCSWQLLLNNNVDLIIEDPKLISSMAKMMNKPVSATRVVKLIPELEFKGFLAANKDIDPVILAKLRAALN